MVMFVTERMLTPAFCASCARARFSSNRVMANQRSRGISFAFHRDQAIGIARIPDHKHAHTGRCIFLDGLTLSNENLAIDPKQILPFHALLTWHVPTSSAQFTSRKPSSRSAVGVTDSRSGNAQSSNSMTTP